MRGSDQLNQILFRGVITLLILLSLFLTSQSSLAAEDQSKRDRLNVLSSQQAELRKQILQKQKEAETTKKRVKELDTQVKRLENDINVTEKRIKDTQGQIEQTQTSIIEKEQEITSAEQELNRQKGFQDEAVRVLYELGDDDPVKIALASTNLSDVIDQNQYLTSVEERVQFIIDEVLETKMTLEEKKEELENKKAEFNRLKSQQEQYKVGLANQQQQKTILRADEKAKQATLEEQITEARQLVNKVESEMASLRTSLTRRTGAGVVQAKDRGTSSVGFQWPTDYSYISTYFGGSTPFQPNGGHGGLDLVNVAGTPVYASADGTVTAVAEMTYNGRFYAYGRYVVIGHNARFSSLYAHLQSFAVSPGDEIKRGDVIGYMGSTGWSTGPHLHFEIWEYDRRANPLGLLP